MRLWQRYILEIVMMDPMYFTAWGKMCMKYANPWLCWLSYSLAWSGNCNRHDLRLALTQTIWRSLLPNLVWVIMHIESHGTYQSRVLSMPFLLISTAYGRLDSHLLWLQRLHFRMVAGSGRSCWLGHWNFHCFHWDSPDWKSTSSWRSYWNSKDCLEEMNLFGESGAFRGVAKPTSYQLFIKL